MKIALFLFLRSILLDSIALCPYYLDDDYPIDQ